MQVLSMFSKKNCHGIIEHVSEHLTFTSVIKQLWEIALGAVNTLVEDEQAATKAIDFLFKRKSSWSKEALP